MPVHLQGILVLVLHISQMLVPSSRRVIVKVSVYSFFFVMVMLKNFLKLHV